MELNFTYWAAQTAAMLLTAWLLPGLTVSGPLPAFATVLGLAFVNSHLWSTALMFHIPDSFAAQSLLLLLANGVIFWIIVKLLPGIEVTSFLAAIAAPVVFSLSAFILQPLIEQTDWVAVFEWIQAAVTQVREYFESATSTPVVSDVGTGQQ